MTNLPPEPGTVPDHDHGEPGEPEPYDAEVEAEGAVDDVD